MVKANHDANLEPYRAGESRDLVFPRLVREEGPRLLSLARRFCGDSELAEDLVQEVFMAAYTGWDQFKGDSRVSTWLFRIASRTCSRMQRKRAGEPATMESLDELLPAGQPRIAYVPGPGEEPLDGEIRDESRRAIQVALLDLPEEFRKAVVLKEIVGFSVAETAKVLEIPEATVKTRLHRARLKLREALESIVPQREVPNFTLERELCMDLLRAKQACLDSGENFAFPDGIFCDRCEVVFRSLDLTQELCQVGRGAPLPEGAENRILEALAALETPPKP